MLITRKSILSGKTTSREIACTDEQIFNYYQKGALLQNAFPDLSDDDREFIKTGITPEEWDATFQDDPKSEPDPVTEEDKGDLYEILGIPKTKE